MSDADSVRYPGLLPDDLRPMTPEEVAEVRSQRITEVDEEPCRVPHAAAKGICAYAGPDGKSACGATCIYEAAHNAPPQAPSEPPDLDGGGGS